MTDFLKERREREDSINNDIAAAAFATDMAELESDDAIKDLIKVAEEERVRGQEYINFRRGLRIITYLVKFCQKDPGGLSFSMNNVLGYQLMFFKGHIDGKARNRGTGCLVLLVVHTNYRTIKLYQFYLGLLLLSHIYARRFP